MNIDSSNILSMLSAGESMNSLQQLIPGDSLESSEFSEALMQKLAQFQSLNSADESTKDVAATSLDYKNQLHEIADLISTNDRMGAFSSFVGNGLPPVNPIEKEIDLQDTLETLANVLNTLELGESETVDIHKQIEATVKTVESIKQDLPEQVEVQQLLDQVVEELEAFKSEKITADIGEEIEIYEDAHNNFEQQSIKHFDKIIENVQQVEHLLGKDVAADVDADINPEINRIKENAKIDGLSSEIVDETNVSTIKQLVKDIESIRESVSSTIDESEKSQQSPATFLNNNIETKVDQVATVTEQVKSINSQQEHSDIQDDLDKLDIENKMATLVASLTDSKSLEKESVKTIYPQMIMNLTKDDLVLKQRVELPNNGVETIDVEKDLLSQNPMLNKLKQNEIDSLFLPEQANKKTELELKLPELSAEKVLPKFATDIANLNRMAMTENKSDIPPMTKHFAHPEWNKEMGERVVWMFKQAVPSAELRLNPGHLGPINIKIDMSQDQATVAFTTQHAAVKEAIDAALPKLREMFSAQQLNLAEVSVSQQDAGQKQPRGFGQMGSDANNAEKEAHEMAENEAIEGAMDITDEIEAGRAIASQGVLSIFA